MARVRIPPPAFGSALCSANSEPIPLSGSASALSWGRDLGKYDRAVVRWLGRVCLERPFATFYDLQARICAFGQLQSEPEPARLGQATTFSWARRGNRALMETPPQESDQPNPDEGLGKPETPAGDPEDPAGGPPPAPDDVDSGIGDAEHDEESAGEDPAK